MLCLKTGFVEYRWFGHIWYCNETCDDGDQEHPWMALYLGKVNWHLLRICSTYLGIAKR